jgi:hypothetical protein
MKTKIVAGIVAFSMLVVISGTALVAANEVYLDPQASKCVACGDTADVEVWVNATEFAGGQINMTYDPTCANVTSWAQNTTNFMIGGWTHYEGREWITFSTLTPIQPPVLTGTYRIGTLTIRCECEKGCVTPLEFIAGSGLFDDAGKPVPANWVNGTFTCGPPQPECLGDCYDTPADGTNCTGKIIAKDIPCYECLGTGMGASWHPTTRCPDRDLYCPDWCFNECPACADGIDNDKDGLTDCPADDGCACCCDYTEEPDEGEPCVPELPTIALTGIGILSLVLWVRSRRGQKRE